MLSQLAQTKTFWKYRHLFNPHWYEGYFHDWKSDRRKIYGKEAKECNTKMPFVLEIGCASAPNLMRIKQEIPDAYVMGVDVSTAALNFAKKKFQIYCKEGFVFANEAPEHLAFDMVIFDRVLYLLSPEEIIRYFTMISENPVRPKIIIDDFFSAPPVKGEKYKAHDYAGALWDLGYKVRSLEPSKHRMTSDFHKKYAKIGIFVKP